MFIIYLFHQTYVYLYYIYTLYKPHYFFLIVPAKGGPCRITSTLPMLKAVALSDVMPVGTCFDTICLAFLEATSVFWQTAVIGTHFTFCLNAQGALIKLRSFSLIYFLFQRVI